MRMGRLVTCFVFVLVLVLMLVLMLVLVLVFVFVLGFLLMIHSTMRFIASCRRE
jgi:hypothetical protein